MPLPMILAAVGRVAAAGAEVFASQAARTAATQAAEQAVAGSASRAAAGTVATQAQGVLESAPGNAKQITMMLKGAPGAGAAAPVAPAAAPTVAPPAASGAATPPPAPVSPAARLPTTPPSQPHAPKSSPLNPINRPMPPDNPAATQAAEFKAAQAPAPSALERIGKFAQGMQSKIGEAKQKLDPFRHMLSPPQKSVEEETKGMSFDQRYQRLQQNGSLLGREAVSKATGNANPSLADAVGASEKAEQEGREESNKKRAESEGAGMKAVKSAAPMALGLATWQVTLPLAVLKASHHIEQWAEGIMESRRGLRKFDSSISNMFARLDRQQLMMDSRRAQNTSGTVTALGRELGGLRKELEPVITAAASTVNLLGAILARDTQIVVWLTKMAPVIQFWMHYMRKAEDALSKGKEGATGYSDFIAKISKGDFAKPKNYRPGPDDF